MATLEGISPELRAIIEGYPTPLTITSGYRPPTHPIEAAKRKPGQHAHGAAVDISMAGMSNAERVALGEYLRSKGVRRFGTYDEHPDMMHVDMSDANGPNHYMHNRFARNMASAPGWFQGFAATTGAPAEPTTTGAPAAPQPPTVSAAQIAPGPAYQGGGRQPVSSTQGSPVQQPNIPPKPAIPQMPPIDPAMFGPSPNDQLRKGLLLMASAVGGGRSSLAGAIGGNQMGGYGNYAAMMTLQMKAQERQYKQQMQQWEQQRRQAMIDAFPEEERGVAAIIGPTEYMKQKVMADLEGEDLQLKQVIGPDGKPVFVREQDALGMEPYSSPMVSIKQTTGEERKAGAFYDRMSSAESVIREVDAPQESGDFFERLKAQYGPNWLKSPEAQMYKTAAAEWIRAKLRKESGAVIGDIEAYDEWELYFPQPTDSPENKELKRKLRQRALESAKKEAGRASTEDLPAETPQTRELTEEERAELERLREQQTTGGY